MVDRNLKFINDIVKPWDELNSLLCEPYAVQPDLSELTRQVNNIAISISHFPEYLGEARQENLMDDIADTAKHGSLRKAERQVIVEVCSCFLCNESGQFKFLRNVPYISKKGMLKVDFMEASLNEIQFIKKKLGIDINRVLAIKEHSSGFEDVAKLVSNSAYCINMSSVRLRFFKKSDSSELIPYDPPKWKLEVH